MNQPFWPLCPKVDKVPEIITILREGQVTLKVVLVVYHLEDHQLHTKFSLFLLLLHFMKLLDLMLGSRVPWTILLRYGLKPSYTLTQIFSFATDHLKWDVTLKFIKFNLRGKQFFATLLFLLRKNINKVSFKYSPNLFHWIWHFSLIKSPFKKCMNA